jgi:predicted HicB family RNase H-like nuclease
MGQDQSRPVGRPPIADVVADLHTRLPAQVYDAIAVEAWRRGVSVAQVAREALVTHVASSGYSPTK